MPYLRGVHEPFSQPREETVTVVLVNVRTISRVQQSCSQTNDRGYWFGNETRCAHAYKIKNGPLRNGQQPDSAGNSFFDYSKFETMKSLSG